GHKTRFVVVVETARQPTGFSRRGVVTARHVDEEEMSKAIWASKFSFVLKIEPMNHAGRAIRCILRKPRAHLGPAAVGTWRCGIRHFEVRPCATGCFKRPRRDSV